MVSDIEAIPGELRIEIRQGLKAFVYCRATIGGEYGKQVLTVQESEARSLARRHSIEVIAIFREKGHGRDLDREKLSELRSRYSEIDAVIARDFDALATDNVTLDILLAEFAEHKISFYSVDPVKRSKRAKLV